MASLSHLQLHNLHVDCESRVKDGRGDALFFPKKIICGLKSMVDDVWFHMYMEGLNPGEAANLQEKKAEFERELKGNVAADVGSVEELYEWMIDQCATLKQHDGERAKIRTFGCYIAAGRLHRWCKGVH